MSPQPFLVSEQHTKRSGKLPMTIALASRWECPCKALCIAPHFHKLVQAVEAFDKRFIVSGARTARWRDYGRVLNRVGIQYWRVNSTAAGIAVWAERRSMSTLAPIGADGISG